MNTLEFVPSDIFDSSMSTETYPGVTTYLSFQLSLLGIMMLEIKSNVYSCPT